VDQIPHARLLPVAQATPARHPRPAPEFVREHLPGIPLRRTKTMPVRHERSETRGRPPLGRRAEMGKNGSTRSHNASGSSAAAIPVHATSPPRIRFRRVLLHALKTCCASSTTVTRRPVSGAPSATKTYRDRQVFPK
jgi:hypothetical protein